MSNFSNALEYLFWIEGGYNNHKNDAGGATSYCQSSILGC